MPKRSRGFWLCDYCELTFDHFDEARVHELQECQNNTTANSRERLTHLALLQQQQQSLFASASDMAPLSRTDKLVAAGVPPSSASSYEPQQAPPRSIWTRPLLDSNDSSSSYLTADDTTACQSLELFSQLTNDTVGLRCAYCRQQQQQHHQQGAEDDSSPSAAASAAAAISPPTIDALGDCVRQLAEQHLTSCSAVPSEVQSVLQRASQKRTQLRAEAGPGWHEEENNLRSLVEFCVAKCRRLGIINRKPVESGIMFDETAAMVVPPQQKVAGETQSLQQQQQWETASNLSAPYSTAGESLEPMPLETIPPPELPAAAAYGMAYPFFQAPNGDWMCKYCSHLPPEYREQHFIWSTPSKNPPTNSFLNHHLSMCSEFIRTNYPYYHQHQQQGHMTGYSYPESQTAYAQQQPMWDTNLRGEGFMSPPAARQRYLAPEGYSHVMQGEATTDVPYDQQDAYVSQARATPQQQQTVTAGGIEPLAMTPLQRPDDSDTDSATQRSIEHLVETDQSQYDNEGNLLPESSKLVVEEDRLLLTDYFYYLMKQLRLVRFSESDRRTRGGKREKIQVGYGGLQCVHCANASNSRKFFWSNVDRLANSFAEIPGHILKCRHCPEQTKTALLQLKKSHGEQMARLPRGSQKVFFRRMWRRLHDDDPEMASSPGPQDQASATGELLEAMRSPPSPLDTKLPAIQDDSPSRTGSEESVILFERPANEAAKALLDASMQARPPSPSSRVLLAIPEDKEWLSDTDCFVRRQIEVFCATRGDVRMAQMERKLGVTEGQVGIRCIHCAIAGVARQDAVAFPFAISGIYEVVREFHRVHLEVCPNLPPAVKSKLTALQGCSSLSSVLRKYYVLSAQALGLHDTKDGVRAGAKPVPVGSQATFAFSDTTVTDDTKNSMGIAGDALSDLSQGDESSSSSLRKRKQMDESSSLFSPDPKRSSPSSNR